jgi:hypothetical protein
VIFELDPNTSNLNPKLFCPNWYAGITAVEVDKVLGHNIEHNQDVRKMFMSRVNECVSNVDLFRPETLDSDAKHSFCTDACSVGLYRGYEHTNASDHSICRQKIVYYMICKSDAGQKAYSLSERLNGLLDNPNSSLDHVIGNSCGKITLDDFNNVSEDGQARRISLLQDCIQYATESVETALPQLCTIDNEASKKALQTARYISIQYNCMRIKEDAHSRKYIYYAGCAPTALCNGSIIALGGSSGFLLSKCADAFFKCTGGDMKAAPVGASRWRYTQEAISGAMHMCEEEEEWIRSHFSWEGCDKHKHIPACIAGTHHAWGGSVVSSTIPSSENDYIHAAPLAVVVSKPNMAHVVSV